MEVSEQAIQIAGFALAHAAWNVSDAPEGELLVPLAFFQTGEALKLVRFEADSQETAIREAKTFIAEEQSQVDAWACAREGLIRNANGVSVDVISVDAWAQGMESPIVFVQAFRPSAAGFFAILGDAVVAVAGKEQQGAAARAFLDQLQEGVRRHPHAGSLWAGWLSA
jgi:hypothetical protein